MCGLFLDFELVDLFFEVFVFAFDVFDDAFLWRVRFWIALQIFTKIFYILIKLKYSVLSVSAIQLDFGKTLEYHIK